MEDKEREEDEESEEGMESEENEERKSPDYVEPAQDEDNSSQL